MLRNLIVLFCVPGILICLNIPAAITVILLLSDSDKLKTIGDHIFDFLAGSFVLSFLLGPPLGLFPMSCVIIAFIMHGIINCICYVANMFGLDDKLFKLADKIGLAEYI
jgi:predicted membrane-bound spermidine synthase